MDHYKYCKEYNQKMPTTSIMSQSNPNVVQKGADVLMSKLKEWDNENVKLLKPKTRELCIKCIYHYLN